MNRQATWNTIGKNINEASNVNEALQLSGLNYKVVKEEIFLADGTKVKGHYATVQEGTGRTFGVVGDDYTIVQNEDAFNFIDNIIPSGLEFVKAGENRKINFIIAKLPEHYILDDQFIPYIIFQNSHNGSSTLKAAICPLRIVCQNQFNMAFRNSDNTISLRHSNSIHDRMVEANKVLQLSASYMDIFAKEAEKLATTKISNAARDRIITNIFTPAKKAGERKLLTIEEDKATFMDILNTDDNQNFKGTAWGLVNAYSDFLTHKPSKRETETYQMNRFMKISLNPKYMAKAMDAIMAEVA